MNPYDNAATYTSQSVENVAARKAEQDRKARSEDHMGYFLNNDRPGTWDAYGPVLRETKW